MSLELKSEERRLKMGAVVLCAALLTISGAVTAAQQDTRKAALDAQIARIFEHSAYALPRFGPARWLDGTTYTTVEAAAGGG